LDEHSQLETEVATSSSLDGRLVVKWALRLVILAGVVWGIYAFVSGASSELSKQEFSWRELNCWWLVLAVVFYAAGLFPACWFWQRILISLGQRPSTMETARAYYVGHLGKYVPGKALVVVIRTALIRSPRVDTTVAAISVFIETLTMMAVGACVSAVVLIFQFRDVRLVWLAVGLMCAAGIPTWPPLFRWFVLKLQVQRINPDIEELLKGINYRLMIQGWLSMTVGWIVMGFSLWAVMQAIPQVALDWQQALTDVPLFTACVSLALVAGFLSLLPGGVGVRELVVMTLIAAHPHYGAYIAIVSAVLLRLSWLMSEVLISGILYLGFRDTRSSSSVNTVG
jgi:uncharacterized membrane protein YbhN (UPF0104 family)